MSYKSTSKRIARQSAHLLGLLVLVAIVVPFVIYAVPGVVGADHSFVVLSGSMEPTASPGDAIIVESVAAARIDTGDVIAFQTSQDGVPTTHRVVSVERSDAGLEFVTKGDANADTDPEAVPQARVIGRVMSVEGHLLVIPYIGHVILFIETPVGFATLVALPIALLVLTEMWSFVRSTRSGGEQTSTRAAESRATDDDGSTAVGPAPAVDANGGSETATESGTERGTGIRIGRGGLALVVPALAAFAAYSVWTVTRLFTPVSIAVAVGSGLLLLLSLLLYVGAEWEGEPTAVPGGGAGTEVAERALATPIAPLSVEVESVEDLLAMARVDGRQVVWDAGRRLYRTVGGPVEFVHDGEPTARIDSGATTPVDEDGTSETASVEDDPWEALFGSTTNRRMTADGGPRRDP
ncbi:MAG: signal peptidase [Halobacteriales archaeon]|jgi:signal peptidase